MYKIITHTIREEHFTHPYTAKIALMQPDANQAIIDPFTTPSALEYMDKVKNAVTKYGAAVRSYLISVVQGSEDMALLKETVDNHALELPNTVFGGYYPLQLSTPVKADFVELNKQLLEGINLYKNKQPTADIESKIATTIKSLSAKLQFMNRFNWPEQAFIDMFTAYKNSVFAQVTDRVNKDWTKDMTDAEWADKILLTGQDNGLIPLVDLLAKGVILQYRPKFH